MADVYSRVRSLEKKLDFIMNNVRMKAAVSSGLSGPDGRPVPARVFEGSLLELYHASRALETVSESEGAEAPPTVDEQTNG